MADIGQTNTYDPDVSWHFHESYYAYEFNSPVYRSTGKNTGNWSYVNYDYRPTAYVFRRSEFGDDTYELVNDFSGQNGYTLFNFDDAVIVIHSDYYVSSSMNANVDDPNVSVGSEYICPSYVLNNYVKDCKRGTKSWPGENYVWEVEEVEEPTPEPTQEPTPTPDPGGDDPGTEINPVDPVDIDSIDDASEILREIYKQDTLYYKDAFELQQNAFDFQVVHVSLMFCSVFLCGILVGCAFARSLWHKMNAW